MLNIIHYNIFFKSILNVMISFIKIGVLVRDDVNKLNSISILEFQFDLCY